MSDFVKADFDAVRGVGAFVDAKTSEYTAKIKAARAARQAEGECWGADEEGETFAKQYVPTRDSDDKNQNDIVAGGDGAARGFHEAARAFEEQETGNTSGFGGGVV